MVSVTTSCFMRRRVLRAGLLAVGALGAARVSSRPAWAASKTIHIGTQKGVTLFLLSQQDSLAKALAPLGYDVDYTEFPGGPQLLEALNVGAIDFGAVGETPPIFVQAAGAPLVYVGHEPSAPKGEAIIVPQNSVIQTVSQLKGKTVALNKGSNVHYLLIQALEKAGLQYSDIQPSYLAPADARAAFEQGSVDAWVIWDPYLAAAEAETNARVLADGTGLVANRQFVLATRNLTDSAPQVVSTILHELDKVDRWAQANRSVAAAELAPGLGLPVSVVDVFLSRAGFGVYPMTPDVVAYQQKVADTFYQLQLIPQKINIAGVVWTAAP
jgi:sulfonate transport system substrate-binding protein